MNLVDYYKKYYYYALGLHWYDKDDRGEVDLPHKTVKVLSFLGIVLFVTFLVAIFFRISKLKLKWNGKTRR